MKDKEKKKVDDADIIDIPENEIDDVEFEELNDEGEELDNNAKIKKLREKIKKLEEEKKENMLGWQRAQADYANFKKEIEARRAVDIKLANRGLIEDILPVLDAYSMASSNKEAWEKVDQNWRIGIEYIFNQLDSVLEKVGLIQFGKVGDKFDPSIHESVGIIETDDQTKDDIIESILSNGYRLGEIILRPAKVKTYSFKN